MKKKLFLFFITTVFPTFVFSQSDSIWNQKPKISYSGFIDTFYSYDFNQPETNSRQHFLFNHNRHNEFNINLALASAKLEHEKYRALIAIQAGTYADDNYSAESDTFKFINEAYAGISLNQQNTLWLDMGIFSSHLGFESALSIDNPTLTRSLVAESSPYFLTGAKLSYQVNSKINVAGIICNGWQRIKRLEGNSLPSFGTQFTYSNEKILLNYSTFIGTDSPDETRKMRYFNNLYSQFEFRNNFKLITGFDFGFEQKEKNSSNYNNWYAPVIIVQKSFSNQWKSAFRVEYFNDNNNVIIENPNNSKFDVFGISSNVDYFAFKNVALRLEARYFTSDNRLFIAGNNYQNFFITTSLAIKI